VELAGAAYACLPVDARPEELFGAWYRMFEFIGGRGGDLPVFPVGEAARLCGRQPAPRAACAWRSILRRTLAPADLRRMAINAQLGDASCLALWALGPVVSVPDPPEVVNGVMEEWLTAEHHLSDVDIQDLRQEWKRRQRRHSIAITLTNAPAGDAGMYWHVFLQQAWLNTPLMDALARGEEQPFVRGYSVMSPMHALTATGAYVDLAAALPSTPQKSVAYVRTFLRVDRRTNVRFWFAYHDRAVFWLNGTRLHSPAISGPARWFDAPSPGAYAVNTVLLPGVNVLAAKIERGGGDWGFSVHAVDADNRPLQHLTVTRTGLPAVSVPAYTNESFTWSQVADDWYRVLPQLDQAALRQITGMPGLRFDPAHFHLGLPDGVTPLPGSRYRAEPSPADRTCDNSLNWDCERAAALRFVRQRRTRDLLLVRPEYLEEFLALLKTAASSRLPSESLRGYIMVPHCTYQSTPDHGPRAVLVLETQLGTYPEDDAALLSTAGAAAYLTTGRTATDAPPPTADE
jgi:hypothetical protein